jgi:hypothetical protein
MFQDVKEEQIMKEDVLIKTVLPQIEELVKRFDVFEKSKHYDDWSGISCPDASEFITAGLNAIHRAVGLTDPLTKRIEATVKDCSPYRLFAAVPHVGGALKALRNDIKSGYLVSVQELIHADIFSDFLEMAEHLLNEGYKDPAAVLVGGVLEEHLRKLCNKNNVSTEITTSSGDLRPKKADRMNADLAKASVYSKLDQKNVTAWLDLRNKAAHGQYSSYAKEQVALFITGIRDFITRNPA